MPISCISGPLQKGLFGLALFFIVIEYFFGIITNTSKTSLLFNTTKMNGKSHYQKTTPMHGPLSKTIKFRNKPNNTLVNKTLSTNSTNSIENNTMLPTVNSDLFVNVSINSPHFNNTLSEIESSSIILKVILDSTTLLPLCPDIAPDLRGRIEVLKQPVPTVQELEKRFDWLLPGGHWHPDYCRPEKKVAIIIPFRCRGEHLLLFLQHMHPFLKRQQLDYTIFILEQDGDGPFNRATLMNVGYIEALKLRNFDCFIFHDIDLLPEDDRNLYTCPEQPRHMSVAVDIFKYRLPYRDIFGGVSAITKDHFRVLNGFSNSFYGWGGEDDDMANRIKHHRMTISRYPINIARYTMLTHKKDKPSPNRYEVLKRGKDRYETDGLSNLKYKIQHMKKNLLYTWMLVGVVTSS